MKNILILCCLTLAIVGKIAGATDAPVYIDVRTWVEHKVDHIDGDTRIHVSDILEGVNAHFPNKETHIRLYCERGVRAETALQKLKAAGYLNVENVGGIDQVRASRFPAEPGD